MLNAKRRLVNEFRSPKRYNAIFRVKYDVPIRVNVLGPPAGVAMKVQRGRSELLSPTEGTTERLTFELTAKVDTSAASPKESRQKVLHCL